MPEKTFDSTALRAIPPDRLEKLAYKKIYFGHQSVGFNIVNGLKDLSAENPQIRLNIVETSDMAAFKDPIFSHSRIGENTDPKSKTDSFAALMEQGLGCKADIAFFKFCYLDIDEKTDIGNVFAHYKKAMDTLKREYPVTTFVHVTVPLRTTKTTWKTRIKKLMGKREIWEYDDNIKRNEFNDLLIKEYTGKEPIFDLAAVESTRPDGTRATFTKDGKTYSSLLPEYTQDGGHLNEFGRRRAAQALLLLLVNLT